MTYTRSLGQPLDVLLDISAHSSDNLITSVPGAQNRRDFQQREDKLASQYAQISQHKWHQNPHTSKHMPLEDWSKHHDTPEAEALARAFRLNTHKHNASSVTQSPTTPSKILSPYERIDWLADNGSQIFEFQSFRQGIQQEEIQQNYRDVHQRVHNDKTNENNVHLNDKPIICPPGANAITVIARIQNRLAIVIASQWQHLAGAWYPETTKKIIRAQQLALRTHLPVIYLVQCSGLFLPQQDQHYAATDGAGGIFHHAALLSQQGVAQLSLIYGHNIAGGAYFPLFSDHAIMLADASLLIAGQAISRNTNQNTDAYTELQRAGSAAFQKAIAGNIDEIVPGEYEALMRIRQRMAQLPSSGCDYFRRCDAVEARYNVDEIYDILPLDPTQNYDVWEIVARLVDASQVTTYLTDLAPEIITITAHIDGLPIAIITQQQQPDSGQRNGSILYRQGIEKITRFVAACDDDGIPVVWLLDVSGFDIGVEAEAEGLLRRGAGLLYQLSQCRGLHLNIILRKASGAGYYAMKGQPFEPTLQLALTSAQLCVMAPERLAHAAYARRLNRTSKDSPEYQKIQSQINELTKKAQGLASAKVSAQRGLVDEVIHIANLRYILSLFAEIAYSHMRTHKAPRLWRLNTLADGHD